MSRIDEIKKAISDYVDLTALRTFSKCYSCERTEALNRDVYWKMIPDIEKELERVRNETLEEAAEAVECPRECDVDCWGKQATKEIRALKRGEG